METLVLSRLTGIRTARQSRTHRSLLTRVQHALCGLRTGHDLILGIDGRRMYLICRHCFHETPGVELPPTAPRPRFR
jgi:hypothetical protein